MTQTQMNELERAIQRATDYGIVVTGHGRRKSDGAQIFTTNSRESATRWHVVALVGVRLVCDCQARKICCHRAAVHMELVVEAANRQAHSDEIEAALREERVEEDATPTPPRAPQRPVGFDAPLINPRGNAAISIWR